jgi:hypothetical protein
MSRPVTDVDRAERVESDGSRRAPESRFRRFDRNPWLWSRRSSPWWRFADRPQAVSTATTKSCGGVDERHVWPKVASYYTRSPFVAATDFAGAVVHVWEESTGSFLTNLPSAAA